MRALATLTLVWLGAQKPDAASEATLARWAHDHAMKLEEPRREPVTEDPGSPALAERCEGWIEQARDQLQAGDDETAQGLLAQLDQTLRQHPELLQAGWLMAERYRLQARIARRSAPEQALRFERLAEVTEGGRAAAFGEATGAPVRATDVQIALAVHGARRHEIYWDGAPSGHDFSTAPGEHHLLVFRGARVAWAGWVSALGSGKIDVWVPAALPCSADDLQGVMSEGARVRVPPGVRCASWAAAAPADRPGAVSIAVCKGDQCQSGVVLTDRIAAETAFDAPAAAKGFLPAWAWTLAGVGVAAATSIVLWRAGVFEPARESRIIYDGTNL
ncbi:MAG TPA: hypothetical protein VK540_22200 [Polyangiaceae bacterium]|nr:hypothetical protein [Polyangiaceae bacterium]